MTRVKIPIQPGDGDHRHGTLSGYTNHACRCSLCRETHRQRHLEYMRSHPEQKARHADRERVKYYARKDSGEH